MGVAAGGNIHPGKTGMFEPIGGSAPKYTGQNVINPLAAIGAVQMMLDYLGQSEAAGWVEQAIIQTIGKMESLSAGHMGMGTDAVGDLVAGFVAKG
jgi:3-isopropylmalate dehydrogenase